MSSWFGALVQTATSYATELVHAVSEEMDGDGLLAPVVKPTERPSDLMRQLGGAPASAAADTPVATRLPAHVVEYVPRSWFDLV